MNNPHSKGSWPSWFILLCSAGLIAIWPLPGTIALRHIFLYLGCLLSLGYIFTHRATLFCLYAWPFWLLIDFFGWLLIHLILFSHEQSLQAIELKSLWLRALLATPLGLSLGLLLNNISRATFIHGSNNSSHIFRLQLPALMLAFAGTFIFFFSRYVYEIYLSGQWIHFPFYEVPYKGKPPFVIASALFLPLCFILIIRGLHSLSNKWWILTALMGIALGLFGDYFANTKNGIAILALCVGVFFANYLLLLKWNLKKFFIGAPVIIFVLAMTIYGMDKHLTQNPAWSNLLADFEVAKDIDQNTWWKNDKVCCAPKNALGDQVNGSTYQRTAWFIAGSRLLIENPLGYGLIHHSFGSLAAIKWSDFSKPIGNMRGATHSAWLDFALGVGIPGLLLVLIPLWVSWWRALHQDGLWYSYASWTIPILSFAYLTTESNEAHFIELLFFMTAFFCGLTITIPDKNVRSSSKKA